MYVTEDNTEQIYVINYHEYNEENYSRHRQRHEVFMF